VAGLPLIACAQGAAADALRARSRWGGEAGPSHTARLQRLVAGARDEVQRARADVRDPARRAALEALEDTVAEYDAALADDKGETARHVRKTLDERLSGVVALARSCRAQERREAARTVGLRPEATDEQAAALRAALLDIYTGEQALAGADPAKAGELEEAFERLRVRPRARAA
jgi:hypothetical protein